MASIEKRPRAAGGPPAYRVIWREGGKKKARTLPTLPQAEMWKSVLEAAQHDTAKAVAALQAKDSTSPPFVEVAEHHLARLINTQPYTLRKYRSYLRNHLADLQVIPVDRIVEDDLIAWIMEMREKGSSPKTIRNVHGFIHSVMDSAVRRRLRQDNPCNGRLLPSKINGGAEATTFLTVPEFESVIQHVEAERRTLFRLMFSTGLRLSEALALTPRDTMLDAATASVRISRAWKQGGAGGWVIGAPKTKRGVRTVALPPSTVEILRPALVGLKLDDYLFWGGEYPGPRQIQRIWTAAVEAAIAGTPPLTKTPRIHDLRHSHASLMIAGGMNLFDLANRLGHESTSTTTEVYGHLVPDAHFKSAAIAETVYGSTPAELTA